jgi:hypothetical protein
MGAIRTVTSADDIDRDDELVLVDTTSGNITVTLADVDTFDNPVTIKKIAAGNTVTIATTDSQNIDSDSTKTLTLLGSAITLYPDTSADLWRVQNPVVSELTATATEINTACDGITATPQKSDCDKAKRKLADDSASGALCKLQRKFYCQDIEPAQVESIGPTGGADHTWTALDVSAADADWIEVQSTACVNTQHRQAHVIVPALTQLISEKAVPPDPTALLV